MIFNSLPFIIFFLLFFFLYWFVFNKSLRYQNILLLAGNYLFYAWWDWRFLFLIILISALNFFLGISIEKTNGANRKRLLFWIGVITGVGGLIFFKYFNFFIESFNQSFHLLHIHL